MAIVKGDTHKHWDVVSRTDRRYDNYSQEFYTCDLNLIQWEKI